MFLQASWIPACAGMTVFTGNGLDIMPLRVLLLLITCCISAPSTAEVDIDDFERGLAAIEMGNAQRAYELWLPLAEANNPNAQFGISMMYMDGIGVKQDFDESVFWLFKAADQAFPPAQFHLGNVYERGIGLDPDIKRAIHWWTLAAEQGMSAAQYRLGQVYWDGAPDLPRDPARARAYLLQAKNNGEFISSEYRVALETPVVQPPPTAAAAPPPLSQMPSCAAWLAAQPAQGYTLQMIAAQKQTSITYFTRQHALTEPHAVCAYRERGQNWFGLFYGTYPSAAEARTAIDRLPAALQANKPYLRSFASLKQLIPLTPPTP